MARAGLVATGMQGFWVRAVVGLVFRAAVIFHLTMDQPQRLARLRQMIRLGASRRRRPRSGRSYSARPIGTFGSTPFWTFAHGPV
jgi:hypothetical protein